MQYPWCRIENPRLSDFLAWADHCFQLDKIKDIMCFHYFIFATRKKSHKLQYINMQVFHFWEKETVYFPNVSVFSCILLPMKWANNNKLSSLWHWKLNKWKVRIKNIKGYRHYVWLQFLVLFRHLHLSLLIPLQNHRGKH